MMTRKEIKKVAHERTMEGIAQHKRSAYKIINPKGVLTRREIGMMTGWGQPYIYLLIQGGKLISSAPTYYGTMQVFTKKDVDKCIKKIKPHNWDNRKGAVNKKRKKAKSPKLA